MGLFGGWDPVADISHDLNTVNQNLSDAGNDVNAGGAKAANDVNRTLSNQGNATNAYLSSENNSTNNAVSNQLNASKDYANTPGGQAAIAAAIATTALILSGGTAAPAEAGLLGEDAAVADTGYLGAETAFGADAAADAGIGADAAIPTLSSDASLYAGGSGVLGVDTSFADAGIGSSSLLGGAASPAAAAATGGGFWSSFGSTVGTAAAGTGLNALIGGLFGKKPADPMKASPIIQPGPSQFAVPGSTSSGFAPSVSSIEKYAVPLAVLAISAFYLSNKKSRG